MRQSMRIYALRRWQLSVTLGVAEFLEKPSARPVKPQRGGPVLRMIRPDAQQSDGQTGPSKPGKASATRPN